MSINLTCSSSNNLTKTNNLEPLTDATINQDLPNGNSIENLTKASNDLPSNQNAKHQQNEISSTENQNETINSSLKNTRKSSLRIAEAAKQKEAMSTSILTNSENELQSGIKSNVSFESDCVERINEEKKTLRPRAPKRTSNEANVLNVTSDNKISQQSKFFFFFRIGNFYYLKNLQFIDFKSKRYNSQTNECRSETRKKSKLNLNYFHFNMSLF